MWLQNCEISLLSVVVALLLPSSVGLFSLWGWSGNVGPASDQNWQCRAPSAPPPSRSLCHGLPHPTLPPPSIWLSFIFSPLFGAKKRIWAPPKQLAPKDPFSPTLPYSSIPSMPFQTLQNNAPWDHVDSLYSHGLQMKPKANVFSLFFFPFFFWKLTLDRIMFRGVHVSNEANFRFWGIEFGWFYDWLSWEVHVTISKRQIDKSFK